MTLVSYSTLSIQPDWVRVAAADITEDLHEAPVDGVRRISAQLGLFWGVFAAMFHLLNRLQGLALQRDDRALWLSSISLSAWFALEPGLIGVLTYALELIDSGDKWSHCKKRRAGVWTHPMSLAHHNTDKWRKARASAHWHTQLRGCLIQKYQSPECGDLRRSGNPPTLLLSGDELNH